VLGGGGERRGQTGRGKKKKKKFSFKENFSMLIRVQGRRMLRRSNCLAGKRGSIGQKGHCFLERTRLGQAFLSGGARRIKNEEFREKVRCQLHELKKGNLGRVARSIDMSLFSTIGPREKSSRSRDKMNNRGGGEETKTTGKKKRKSRKGRLIPRIWGFGPVLLTHFIHGLGRVRSSNSLIKLKEKTWVKSSQDLGLGLLLISGKH